MASQESSSGFLLVTTTLANRADAQELARITVERHLAACVQVLGPITSTFWWQGKVESAEEWFCLCKTHVDRYQELEFTIRDLHPYQVPEIIALPISHGSSLYLQWIRHSLTPEASEADAKPQE